MQKKKENFLEKIVKKDYNNQLETVIEKKYFEEDAKNILLNILYKLEASYKDYEQVKRDVMPKQEFLQNIIDIIQNDCDNIKIVKMNSEDAEVLGNKSFLIDKKNKKIICFPIERKLLYCISKISKSEEIVNQKYIILHKTLTDLLNVGNNINSVEPLRDFNGFSWTTIDKEIESITHNLIYQNLRILVGEKFLHDWIYNKDYIMDYFEIFKNKLEQNYSAEIQNQLLENISKLSILLELKFNEIEAGKLKQEKADIEKKLEEINDREEFVKKLTKEKKEINKKIKNIDTIKNSKELLQKEYIERNELLPLDKKIFSMRILSNMMSKEKEALLIKIDNLNDMLNPHKFIEYKTQLDEKYKLLKLVGTKNLENEIKKLILNLQKIFINCFEIKINNVKTKEEIINLIFEYRYYLNLPYDYNCKIYQVKELTEQLNNLSKKMIDTAITHSIFTNISENKNIVYNVLDKIFYSKIINLQDVYIKLVKDNNILLLQLFDENIFENKVELRKYTRYKFKRIKCKIK